MDASLSRTWWSVALRGLVYVLFGLTALLLPGPTFGTLVLLFGVFSLLDGGLALGGAFRTGREKGRWGGMALEGLISLAVGITVLVWPEISGLALLYVIAAWAGITGILEIAAAVRLRREIKGEWLLMLSGGLSLAFGIAVFAWPASSAMAIVWVLGVYALLFAGTLFGLSWRMRQHARQAGP